MTKQPLNVFRSFTVTLFTALVILLGLSHFHPFTVWAAPSFQGGSDCDGLQQEGIDLDEEGAYEEALQKLESALACYRRVGNAEGEGTTLKHIGNVEFDLEQYEQARQHYEKALTIAKEIGNQDLEARALNNIGLTYRSLGKIETAIDYHEKSIGIAKGIGAQEVERIALSNQGIAYHTLGLNHFSQAEYKPAIEYLEQALTCYREADSQQGEGNAWGDLGTVYLAMGQYEKALEHCEQALAIAQEMGDQRGKGVHLGNLGTIYSGLGKYEKAIECHDRTLTIARDIGNHQVELKSLGNLGNDYQNLGLYEEAIRHHKQALAIAREIGDYQSESKVLGNLGIVYQFLGQYHRAIQYYQQALAIAKELNDHWGEENHLGNLGVAYESLGQYERAIGYYEQALSIAREIGDRQGERSWLSNLGNAYLLIGQYERSINYYEQALSIAREIDDRQGEGACLGNLGVAYESLGQYERSINYYEQALSIAQEIGDRNMEGSTLGNLGITYDSLGQYATAIDYYEQVLAIAQKIGDRQGEGNHLGNLGLVYSSLGQYATAIEHHEQALSIAREIGDRRGEGNHLGNLGIAYESLGQYTEALDYYEQSIAVRETLREEIKVEEWKSSFAAENIGPYRDVIKVLLKLDRSAEAFHYAQRAKARSFLDQMGNARIDPRATYDPELIEQEQALLNKIRGLESVLSGQRRFETLGDATRGSGPNTLTDEQREEVQNHLDEAYREYEHLLNRIKLSNPEYADLRTVDASKLITVQQTLPAATTLVEYYVVSDTQTLAFVVTPDAFHTVPLSVSVESLNQKINWFREFTSEEEARATAQTLYDWLFAPVREHIETQAVLIAPHQQLHYLPFDALHNGEHYLVEEYTIGYIPSASVLRYVNAGEQGSGGAEEVLVLGNPTSDAVSPLPAAEREAQAVADLFGTSAHLGEAATESRLWEQAADAGYVHLAAHGEFKETAPQFSRVYLAPSEAEDDTVTGTLSSQTDGGPSTHTDGLLETREVWNLRLENADLVTLSACQTQLGDLSAGDELVGLSRAFIYAGTPTLVASLWSVEDRSTAYLMERFYGYLQDGMGKAEALRQAKLDTMETYSSPYHWAAFTLIGDMGEVEAKKPESQTQLTPTAEDSDDQEKSRKICPGMAVPLALVVVAAAAIAGHNRQGRRR